MKTFRTMLFTLLALVIVLVAGPASAAQPKKLDIFIWSQYMDPAIITAFEKKYHVEVVQNNYGSLPEMFAKLRAGGDSQYDIVVPSNYYVQRLIKTGLLQPLDHSEIPNLDNLMSRFRNAPFDPHNKYTAAYQWGDTGIAYNTDDITNAPDSWSILFDPKVNSKYPFVMGTDAQVMFGAACAYQGKQYACTGQDNWKQAARLILKNKQRSNFSGFMDDTPLLKNLARGNMAVGLAYNGDYAFDKKNNPSAFAHIKFIVPKEGAELWVDSMAIPAHAPHPMLANEFINFILEAKIGAQLSNYNSYASPNKKSLPMLNPELRKPPVVPTDAQMKRLHYTPSIKGDQLQFVQQLWTEIQAQ
ncbi:MAG: spermidine/putrescine ABC transporter substrate-binding protein [Salinisphaera sp.]|jgi:spermidine/putrescine transport system substrate-binding protein|nr:spermidine/putrescine ABC transporter substrate-binding protein [Salinisphaera sp.]